MRTLEELVRWNEENATIELPPRKLLACVIWQIQPGTDGLISLPGSISSHRLYEYTYIARGESYRKTEAA